jgi:glycosyltransferase involved in cell wall biosynthesis
MSKMNLVLINKGHDVHLITKRMVPYAINYKSHSIGQNYDQVREAMRLYEPHVDLLHAHNEPSWYVTLWKEVSDKPVILDVHDSCLARLTPQQWVDQNNSLKAHNVRVSAEERNNFQLADGLIFPARSFADLITKEFALTQPWTVVPSYVPRHFYSYFPLEWHGGIVYQGKVAQEHELPMFNYCDYREFAKQTSAIGMDFHIYPAGYTDKLTPLYNKKGMDHTYLHTPELLEELIRNLGRHDWGLVGNVTRNSEWDLALPNKLFEYVAAGTPVAVMNADESAELVLKLGIGIVVKSIQELAERWSEHRKIRANIAKVRMSLCMENQIHTVEKFYEEILCHSQAKKLKNIGTKLNGLSEVERTSSVTTS